MALLKNLQEKYVPRSGLPRDREDGVDFLSRDELADKILMPDTQDSEPGHSAAMRRNKRSKTTDANWGKRQGSDKAKNGWQKLKKLLGLNSKVGTSGSNQQHQPELADLMKRNQLLANRLEQLEDRSWEIRESEEIHRSLFEAFGDIVLHHNGEGERVFQNRVFDTYFGDLIRPDFHALTGFDKSPEPGSDQFQVATREVELETLMGPRWFSWTNLPVRDPQTGAVGVRSVARDITQQKTSEGEILNALEKAEIANEAKSKFLAMVSHEIRTPLNGIIGMAGLLSEGKLAPDQKTYVDAINSSGNTLLNLIEDLLDTARIESGNVELTPRATNLTQLVEDVAELLAPVAQEKGLELATHVAGDLPHQVSVDSGRLRQVLLNLVGNAIKFTKSGGIGLNVTSADESGFDSKGMLRFTVRDSGPGLTEADQQRIFEEFVQTDDGATREHGGAGLGLAISKNLVELMDGQISVASNVGRGTAFELTVPVASVEQEPDRQPIQDSLQQNVALVIKRTPARQSLMRSIKDLGVKVHAFDSLKAFNLNYADMGFLDAVIAPFAEWDRDQLKGLQQALPDATRIINIGDASVTKSSETAEKSGIDAWLTRPVRKQTLYRILSNQLDSESCDENLPSSVEPEVSPLNILLAEDNPINALLAKSQLNKMGHRVIHVVDGSQAVEAVEGHMFDLVLMDLHMPIMDGIAALRKIRSLEEEKAATPVIVLSADGQTSAKDDALAQGAEDFLVKPIRPDDLGKVLARYAPEKNGLPEALESL